MSVLSNLQRMLPSTPAVPEVLHDWRERILSTILLVITVLGALTSVPSIWLAAHQQRWSIAWIDGVALVWVLALWRRPGLSYRFRAWNLLLLIYLLGIWFLFNVGPASQIYLMAFPVMAALLLAIRPALLALAVNAVTLMVIGYLGHGDLHLPGFEERPLIEWVVITVNFMFVNSVITLSCGVLLNRLESSLDRQLVISRSLEEGQVHLRTVNDELQRTATALNRLAYFDELTGLPNRRMLMDRLAHALAAARHAPLGGALLYLDLDRFKNVNDARGHVAGDALLGVVAQRLSTLMRDEDTVARLGGDEFVILSTQPTHEHEHDGDARATMAVAGKVRDAFEQPFIVEGQPYSVSASIGVVVLGRPDQTAEEVLRNADTAMCRAKAAGRSRIAFFEAAMQREVEEHLALESELTRAIVQMILSMARHLGLKVVAEGVETRAQADFLAANGCDAMQGFLYSHPQPLEAWLGTPHETASIFASL